MICSKNCVEVHNIGLTMPLDNLTLQKVCPSVYPKLHLKSTLVASQLLQEPRVANCMEFKAYILYFKGHFMSFSYSLMLTINISHIH